MVKLIFFIFSIPCYVLHTQLTLFFRSSGLTIAQFLVTTCFSVLVAIEIECIQDWIEYVLYSWVACIYFRIELKVYCKSELNTSVL